MTELIEAWRIHDRINGYMLDAIAKDALGATANGKGRTVAGQFAHMHNVRLMWLKVAAPELLEGLEKIEEPGSAAPLKKALEASGEAIEALLTRAGSPGGKVKNFKPHAAGFFGYLVSHESHHRGQIALTLKLAGFPLDKKVAFGIWEWGSR